MIFPVVKLHQRIAAHEEVNVALCEIITGSELTNSLDGIRYPTPLDLNIRKLKSVIMVHREPQHLQPVLDR